MHRTHKCRWYQPRAFTLIELLVVIAIISVLASILLPALVSARRTAKSTAGVINLRSAGQIMELYTQDHAGAYLFPWHGVPWDSQRWQWAVDTLPPKVEQSWLFDESDDKYDGEQFGYYWYSFIAHYRGVGRATTEMASPADPDMVEVIRSFHDNGSDGSWTLCPSSFVYSPTMWTAAERYSEPDRAPMDGGYLKTQRTESVLYPAAKAVLFQRADFAQTRRVKFDSSGRTEMLAGNPSWNNPRSVTPVALADGSIDNISMPDLTSRAAGRHESAMELVPAGNAIACTQVPLIPGGAAQRADPFTGSKAAADAEYPAFFWATRNGVKGRDIAR